MKKAIVIFLLIIFFANIVFAQKKSIIITGKIIDKTTKLSIQDVNIKISGTAKGTISNSQGIFTLKPKKLPVTLYFSHIGYAYKKLIINSNKTELNVKLQPITKQINEVRVFANKIEKILGKKPFYIIDYELYNDNILLLALKNAKSSNKELILINYIGDVICQRKVNKSSEKLFKDCTGNIQLLTNDSAFQINFTPTQKKIQLLYPLTLKKFETILLPCLSVDSNKYFFYDNFYNKQGVVYYDIDNQTKRKKVITYIINKEKLNHLKDENNYLFEKYGYTQNEMHSIKGKSLIEMQKNMAMTRHKEINISYDKEIFFTPISSFFSIIKNQVAIFNFVDSQIEFYNSQDSLIKNIKIEFNKYPNWQKKIFVDKVTNKVYTHYRKNGISTIREIDMNTGYLKGIIKIPNFQFVEKIKIRNGHIYFLYKDNSLMEYKKLYKMMM